MKDTSDPFPFSFSYLYYNFSWFTFLSRTVLLMVLRQNTLRILRRHLLMITCSLYMELCSRLNDSKPYNSTGLTQVLKMRILIFCDIEFQRHTLRSTNIECLALFILLYFLIFFQVVSEIHSFLESSNKPRKNYVFAVCMIVFVKISVQVCFAFPYCKFPHNTNVWEKNVIQANAYTQKKTLLLNCHVETHKNYCS
jgi:hypothetical protein